MVGPVLPDMDCPFSLSKAALDLRKHFEQSTLGRISEVPAMGLGLPNPGSSEVETILRNAGLRPTAPMRCEVQVLGTPAARYWSCYIDETDAQYVALDFDIDKDGKVSLKGIARVSHAESEEPKALLCSVNSADSLREAVLASKGKTLYPGRFATSDQYRLLRQGLQAMLGVTGSAREAAEKKVNSELVARFREFAGPIMQDVPLSASLHSSDNGSTMDWTVEAPVAAAVRAGFMTVQLSVTPARVTGEAIHLVFVKGGGNLITRDLTPTAADS